MATAIAPVGVVSEADLAARYLSDLVYGALLDLGEPAKASDVARAVGRDDVDLKLTRVVLATDPRMTAVDRKWTLWTRFMDVRNAIDRNIGRIIGDYGRPMRLTQLSRELHAIYHRPADIFYEVVERIADDGAYYFRLDKDLVAPTVWLLDTEPGDEDEVLFENFLSDEEVLPFVEAARSAGLDWRHMETVARFLDTVGRPIRSKALQFLLWQSDKERFDAAAAYCELFSASGATLLSDGAWIGPRMSAALLSHFAKLGEQEISENAEAEAQEAAQPLSLGERERDNIVRMILERDETVHAAQLLEEMFDVTPEYRTYSDDLRTMEDALKADERIVWVGADRFRPAGTTPGYVYTVPALLDIPNFHFTDTEGNEVDLLIEDEGFNGGLQREINSPLAQDVLDEEPVPPPDPNPPSNARAVIKYHHKQIGTLPLCQFPNGFFPPEPVILETEFELPSGQRARVWVNNETRLLYGLLDWYESIPIDSGATFTLERKAPDQFKVNYNEESEPTMFISRNRINELLELQERIDEEEQPTLEIVRQIMEHYRKGIEYLTLLTEVNIVRRINRRLVASLLSEYSYFTQRGGAWVFDPKKLVQGFDKSKRKYLVKSE